MTDDLQPTDAHRRVLRWLVFAACLALCLAACGGSEPDPNEMTADEVTPVIAEGVNGEAEESSPSDADSTEQQLDSDETARDLEPAPDARPTGAAFRFAFDDGGVEGYLSDRLESGTPLENNTLPEGTANLWLHVSSDRVTATRLYVKLRAVDVDGADLDIEFFSDFKLFLRGETWSPRISLPMNGLGIGHYALELAIESGPQQSLDFEVTSAVEPAKRAAESLPPEGFNVAARALGGRILQASVEASDPTWQPANLLDGFTQTYDRRGRPLSSGWRADMTVEEPPEVVIGFANDARTSIHAVILVPARPAEGRGRNLRWEPSETPRYVEVLVSTDEDATTFESVATARLYDDERSQWVGFPAVEARFVKLRLLNNYGAERVALGEFMVLEATAAAESVLAGRDIDLASPALGGGLAWLTSQDRDHPAAGLFGLADDPHAGWRSGKTKRRSADDFPQDFVLTFSNDRIARVERVELLPLPDEPAARWISSVTIGVGAGTGRDFEEVTRISVPAEPGPVVIPVDRDARMLRVRLLDNHGGDRTTVGRLRVIEGAPPGYTSLLHDHVQRLALGLSMPVVEPSPPLDPDQNEPNDIAANAVTYQLGREENGNLHSAEDQDYFSFKVGGESDVALTVNLTGVPSIRTELALEGPAGALLKLFQPAGSQGSRTRFTWSVSPGDYFLRLLEPTRSLVLVWDTSGSMEGRMAALEPAVRQFLADLQPNEQVQLIRFSDSEKVLLEEFTSDTAVITDAIRGQFRPLGGTSLIDALNTAESLLVSAVGQRAILVFTDGQDTASDTDESEFWSGLGDSATQIFAIGLGDDLSNYSYRTGGTGNQFLNNLASLSNGNYFHAAGVEAIGAIFQAVAARLRARPEYSFVAETGTGHGSLRVVSVGEPIPALAPPRFELILDASGSMKRTVADGRTRMAVAQSVLKEIVADIPDGVEVGLRVFGHRIAEGQPGDCSDTELIQEVDEVDKAALKRRIDGVQALGTTLIAHTLEQLPGDLGPTEQEQFVVLVTDGEEECREDLVETVSRLKAGGLNVRLSIVGFAIDDDAINQELAAVAEAGGGIFVQADLAEELRQAFDQALAATYVIQDASGFEMARGFVNGAAMELSEGDYEVMVPTPDGNLSLGTISITAETAATLELNRQGSEIGTNVGSG